MRKQTNDSIIFFVSSTFRDMLVERDIINHDVIPRLNEKLKTDYVKASAIDLRWGIDTTKLSEKVAGEKIFSVCFDEIRRSQAIIILLGDNYGYVPSANIIANVFPKEDITDKLNLSVTHMEILHALKSDSLKTKDIFVYSKNKSHNRVNEIENLLISKYKLQIHKYDETSLHDGSFSNLVIDNLYAWYTSNYESKTFKSECDEFFTENLQYISNFSRNAFFPDNFLEYYSNDIDAHRGEVNIIKAEGGVGKTTLITTLYNYQKHANKVIVSCDYSSFSSNVRNISEFFYASLCIINNKPYDFIENKEKSYAQIIDAIRKDFIAFDKPIFLYIDAIDTLYSKNLIIEFINSLTRLLDKNITIICSTRNLDFINDNLKAKVNIMNLTYSKQDAKNILKFLADKEGKEISDVVMKRIIKKRNSLNPLWLKLIVQRILMLGKTDFDMIYSDDKGIKSINKHMISIIKSAPDDLQLLSQETLQIAFQNINDNFCNYVALYIYLSRDGITETDLKNIYISHYKNWNSIDFARMLHYLRYFFSYRYGNRIEFSHKEIKESISSMFIDDDKSSAYVDLLNYFHDDAFVNSKTGEEYLWYSYKSDNPKQFVYFLSKIMMLSEENYSLRFEYYLSPLEYILFQPRGSYWLLDAMISHGNSLDTSLYASKINTCLTHLSNANPSLYDSIKNLLIGFITRVGDSIVNKQVKYMSFKVLSSFYKDDKAMMKILDALSKDYFNDFADLKTSNDEFSELFRESNAIEYLELKIAQKKAMSEGNHNKALALTTKMIDLQKNSGDTNPATLTSLAINHNTIANIYINKLKKYDLGLKYAQYAYDYFNETVKTTDKIKEIIDYRSSAFYIMKCLENFLTKDNSDEVLKKRYHEIVKVSCQRFDESSSGGYLGEEDQKMHIFSYQNLFFECVIRQSQDTEQTLNYLMSLFNSYMKTNSFNIIIQADLFTNITLKFADPKLDKQIYPYYEKFFEKYLSVIYKYQVSPMSKVIENILNQIVDGSKDEFFNSLEFKSVAKKCLLLMFEMKK